MTPIDFMRYTPLTKDEVESFVNSTLKMGFPFVRTEKRLLGDWHRGEALRKAAQDLINQGEFGTDPALFSNSVKKTKDALQAFSPKETV